MADANSTPSVGEVVAANYRILGTAGAGGMGVVYRALDLRLERTVALKFLPADLTASERDKDRFLREARTASALDHPNIGVIYGIEDTADERSFIAMAFYEGKSLAQRIRSGPLSAAEAADIVIQILKGLEYAHARGIEHRDVKPSNIMLAQQTLAPLSTSGPLAPLPASTATALLTVKIVDFGLAHVSQQTASKTHGLSGTIAYMSPEQTLGRAVDGKVDIWATGIVLVEMLTGQNPFSRDTIPATVFAILNEPPRLPDTVPPDLQQVAYRALSKDPVRRYQGCSEMLRDLELIRPGLPNTAATGPNPPAGPEGKSARRTRESGDLRRSREYASISAWAPPKARANWKPWVFGLGTPALLLGVALFVPPLRERLAGLLPTVETGNHRTKQAAYEGYLAALGYMDRYDKPGNLDRAVTALEGSLKIDPLFALGYAQLGEAYRLKFQTDHDPKWLDLALSNCQRAEQLDNRIPAIYATLAEIHNNQGKHDLAFQEFHQALDLNSRDVGAVSGLARANAAAGNLNEAEDGLKKAIALRPDDWSGPSDLAQFYATNGKYKQAVDSYKQAVNLSPDNAYALNNLASAYLSLGDADSLRMAEEALKTSLIIQPSYVAYSNLGVLYLGQKRYSESADMTRKAIAVDDKDYLVWENLRTAEEWLHDRAAVDAVIARELPLLEKHIRTRSQDGLAHSILATLYAKQGNAGKAEAHIQSALAFAPESPETLEAVADAYESMGNHRQALAYLHQAVAKGASADIVSTDADLQSLLHSSSARVTPK